MSMGLLMIKLLFIISNLGQGGAERQLLELVKNIDKNLFEVCVCLYAVNKGIFFKEIEKIPGINFTKNTLKYKTPIIKILEAMFFIHRYLKQNDFDVIHTSLSMNGALVRLSAPGKYKNKIVYNVRTSFNLYIKKILFLERILIRKSFLITNSKSAYLAFVRFMPDKYKSKMKYIYNGFDTNKFKPFPADDSSKITIGSIGRIHNLKNHIQIIRVFNELENDNLELVIVGDDGGQKVHIEKYIEENKLTKSVRIISQQNNIEDYYNKFDIFILSSLLEGCPNVLFEAMLCKCFCIISRNANSDDFVIDGENGLVYDGTDGDLKIKLEFAISIKGTEIFNKIRVNGYHYAKNNFSMEHMVKSYEDLYINILNKNTIE
jgi:glycosyltransferase involved in cell wall biosynthesis